MFALAYTSEAMAPFDESSLLELAQLASAKNKRLEITGYFTYDFASESFFQFLEGARDSVEGLMSTIEQDPRHRILSLLPILNEERLAAIRQSSPNGFVAHPKPSERMAPPSSEVRLFPNWTMRLFNDSDFQRFDLSAELVEALILIRKESLSRAAAVDAVTRLSRKLAVSCHAVA